MGKGKYYLHFGMRRSSAMYEKLNGHAKLHANASKAKHTVIRLVPTIYCIRRSKIVTVLENSVRLR